MHRSALLIAVLLAGAAPAALAQEARDAALALGMDRLPELTPEEQDALQRLEADLVGPIASVDYYVLAEAAATDGPIGAAYSRMATVGFPDAALPQFNFPDGVFWMLGAPLQYRPGNSNRSVTVPKGFVHDFASVPAIATPFVPKHGPYNRAAIVHDFLYWAAPCTRLEADNLFLISMIEAGVAPWRRWGIYRAVRLAGWSPWSSNKAERTRGLPRVVPDSHFAATANEAWARLRAALFDAGIRDAVVVDDASFCELGNSTEVPDELMAEAGTLSP